MSGRAWIKGILVAGLTTVTLGYQACSRVDNGAGRSSSEDSSKSGGTTTDNPKPTVSVILANSGSNTSVNTELCLGQIQFSGNVGDPSSNLAPTAGASYNYGMAGLYQQSPYSAQLMMGNSDQFLAAMMQFTQSLMGMNFTLMPQGSLVKTISLVPGSYTNIDLTLDRSCSFGSLSVPTASGVLQMSDPLVLHFVGNINLSQPGRVVLNVADILDALSGAANSADVKAILGSVNGSF